MTPTNHPPRNSPSITKITLALFIYNYRNYINLLCIYSVHDFQFFSSPSKRKRIDVERYDIRTDYKNGENGRKSCPVIIRGGRVVGKMARDGIGHLSLNKTKYT